MVESDERDGPVLFETADGIAQIRLNNPSTRNALSMEAVDELTDIATQISEMDDIAVIVISATGPVFCSGLDREIMQNDNADELTALQENIYDLYYWLRNVQIPVITGAQGHAVGAGASLLCYASDIQVVAKNAEIWWPEIQYGVVNLTRPIHLAHLVGPSKAAEIVLLGDEARIPARDAYHQGLVSHLEVDPDDIDPTCIDMAETIAHLEEKYGVIAQHLDAIYQARREMMATSLSWAEAKAFELS